MKKIFSLLLMLPLAAVLCLQSCDADKSDTSVPELTVSPESLEVEASDKTVTYTITVDASDIWAVTSAPDWTAVTDLSESGFTLEIEPYTEGAEESREGTVTVEMGELMEKVRIVQHRFVPETPFVLEVTPDEISNADPAEVYEITVEASHEWSVDTKADWIVVSGVSEAGFCLQVEDYGDLEDESRTGSVVVSSEGEEREVTVTQFKPAPAIPTVEDFLGEWTITGKMQSLLAPGLGGFDGERDYYSVGEMVLREEIGENVVSIPVFGVEENFDEPTDLFLTFDPETGTLRNNNYVKGNGASVTCTFSTYSVGAPDWSGWEARTFYPLEEGTLSLSLDDTGKLVVPATVVVDGEEKELAICEFYPESGITWSMIYVYDIAMSKN